MTFPLRRFRCRRVAVFTFSIPLLSFSTTSVGAWVRAVGKTPSLGIGVKTEAPNSKMLLCTPLSPCLLCMFLRDPVRRGTVATHLDSDHLESNRTTLISLSFLTVSLLKIRMQGWVLTSTRIYPATS